MTEPGYIVVLNGVPRSGKTSIASAMQDSFDGLWLNIGVDSFSRGTSPLRYLPGIGLRPGGERPDLEPVVSNLYDALWESVITQRGLGLNVVVDVGLHDDYSVPLGILDRASRRLHDLPAYLIGVRCPVDVIMDRRAQNDSSQETSYVTRDIDGSIPEPILRWERAVHDPGIYDLEVNTAQQSPEECVMAIGARIKEGPASAFREVHDYFGKR